MVQQGLEFGFHVRYLIIGVIRQNVGVIFVGLRDREMGTSRMASSSRCWSQPRGSSAGASSASVRGLILTSPVIDNSRYET